MTNSMKISTKIELAGCGICSDATISEFLNDHHDPILAKIYAWWGDGRGDGRSGDALVEMVEDQFSSAVLIADTNKSRERIYGADRVVVFELDIRPLLAEVAKILDGDTFPFDMEFARSLTATEIVKSALNRTEVEPYALDLKGTGIRRRAAEAIAAAATDALCFGLNKAQAEAEDEAENEM